ncbi:MAG: GNAT family N-acetyltransferase [Tenericutes bacterium]|nr:GNAT family N-acetyltransferase [Mycoplasmatota bacterium]
MIKLAKLSDIDKIVVLAKKTRENMLNSNLQQWIGDYPNKSHFLSDYEENGLYTLTNIDNNIIASITIINENEEAYREIKWLRNKSMVIHRVIVNPEQQKKGIGMKLFQFAIDLAKVNNYDSIKVDTHPDNLKMQALIKKMGFRAVGYLSGINRLAYELVL